MSRLTRPPKEIEPQLLPLWPDVGMTLGFRSRSATYAAAAKGHIKVIRFGKAQRVPKQWLERAIAGEAA
jgi:hypothetical protein